MRKSFALNTIPHEAEIGDAVLQFVPEVPGDEFLDGYTRLRDAQKTAADGEDTDPEHVRKVTAALREFLTEFMLPDSRQQFATMQLPTRVLMELTEWVAELYGGGASERPTGRSSGSPQPRRTPGTPSKAS